MKLFLIIEKLKEYILRVTSLASSKLLIFNTKIELIEPIILGIGVSSQTSCDPRFEYGAQYLFKKIKIFKYNSTKGKFTTLPRVVNYSG